MSQSTPDPSSPRSTDALQSRLRDLLSRLESDPAVAGSEPESVVASLRDAIAELDEAGRREKIYRETTRRLNRDFERKVLELSILRQIGDLIAGSLKVDDLLVPVLDVLVREFRVDNTSVMLLDEATGDLRVEAGRGANDEAGLPRPASIRCCTGSHSVNPSVR